MLKLPLSELNNHFPKEKMQPELSWVKCTNDCETLFAKKEISDMDCQVGANL